MTSGPISLVDKFDAMQSKMDSIKAQAPSATFAFASLDMKEYYDNMTVETAVETVDESFTRTRNDGEYFSIEKAALYKLNLA